MINFAEFIFLVPRSERVELHIIEGNDHIHMDEFDQDNTELNYPWYQYRVVTFYSYYDRDNDDSVLHILISYAGEDTNYVKEE